VLKRLTVKNYRSLERAQVALHPLTAFVGANGTGKSSLLRAIDLVLGQRYPNVSSLRFSQDFTLAGDRRELRIAVRLAEPWVHVDARTSRMRSTDCR